MTHSTRIASESAPPIRQLIEAFWTALRAQVDADLPETLAPGLGSTRGARLSVKWAHACDEGEVACLGLDVLDTSTAQAWEFALCPLPDGRTLAHQRRTWEGQGATTQVPDVLAAWDGAVADHLTDQMPSLRHSPSFMGIAAAVAAQGDIAVSRDDSAKVATLQADLDYWRSLAREQGRQRDAHKADQPYRFERIDPPTQENPTPEAARSWRLKDIGEWAAANSHRIVILPRAIAETKRAIYEAPEFMYACLELLAEEYTSVKCSLLERNAFKDKADRMGLDYGGSVDPSVAGEKGDSYFVRWNGKKRFLDQHLCKGTSRDPRFTLRIYFTWDEVIGKVVVGWMPTHLGIGIK